MTTRQEYKMTPEDLAEMLECGKPAPMIMLQCGEPLPTEERMNAAWVSLGERMGFEGMTAQPSPKGAPYFTAEPTAEPEEA